MPAWTSNLSVGGALATRGLGLIPLGQVMSVSVYRMSRLSLEVTFSANRDLASLARALHASRERALERLQEQARRLGAHGIVDVRLAHTGAPWGAETVQTTASGTAVRLARGPHLERCFAAGLSPAQTASLLKGGYVPVDVVLGCAAYYVATSWDDQQQLLAWLRSGRNGDMASMGAGLTQALRLASERLAANARHLGADGVLALDTQVRTHALSVMRVSSPSAFTPTSFLDHIVEVVMTGTAVAAVPQTTQPLAPALVLDLART